MKSSFLILILAIVVIGALGMLNMLQLPPLLLFAAAFGLAMIALLIFFVVAAKTKGNSHE